MNSASNQETSEATWFDEVLRQEHETIAARRSPATPADQVGKTAALAFSGGGIRSAVFNLGFIQGLANRDSLHVFDYLSTVSGGGYIGGWLSALHYRKAGDKPAGEADMKTLQAELLPPTGKQLPDAAKEVSPADKSPEFPASESDPIRYLRRYSNYLTPRLGLSGDTLALISLMARNMVVMQLLLVSLLVTVFALLLFTKGVGEAVVTGKIFHLAPLVIAILILFFFALGKALKLQNAWVDAPRRERNPSRDITLKVLLPALLSGILTAILLDKTHAFDWRGSGALGVGAVYLIGWRLFQRPANHKAWAGVLGGAVTLGALFFALLSVFPVSHALTYAPVVTMLVFSLTLTVHLALAGDAVSEAIREWWARLGGQGMLFALAWTTAFLFLNYVPPLMQYGVDNATRWLAGLWAALTWLGTNAARGKNTGGGAGKLPMEILAQVAPWVFLAGLLGLVAWAFVLLLGIQFGGDNLSDAIIQYQAQLGAMGLLTPGIVLFGALLVFGILVRHVDLNLFSAHSFYVNRLARTFLGASQDKRHPDPYTGFDPHDDLQLGQLAQQRPIHLINTTLNLTGGEDLAWQTRRGACFTFTPAWTGYTTRNSKNEEFGGFRPTSGYGGGLSLATAVAVSGAAASPNMGFHTATSVAALLTAFNLRLARWCPNPARRDWDQCAPRTATRPFFAELFGDTTGNNTWVNLSDGGHFENLGLYELIRRRVAFIVVTDAAADGAYRFDDLAMAVRKIAVDFGVNIDIPENALNAIRPPEGSPFSAAHWAFGRINYPDGDPGYLIYVKNSIDADAPIDIRQYRDANPAFPHESTADQWFDEDQFEAYRHLGQTIAEALCQKLELQTGDRPAAAIVNTLYHTAQTRFDSANAPQGEPT